MKDYLELLQSERNYYKRLTGDERRLYLATPQQLTIIDSIDEEPIHQFVLVAKLMHELNRIHARYNDCDDVSGGTTEERRLLDEINEELFSVSISIGLVSAVLTLSNMDECDALYNYLVTVKCSRFDHMRNTVDIEPLVELISVI